jgi:hypothetical protein
MRIICVRNWKSNNSSNFYKFYDGERKMIKLYFKINQSICRFSISSINKNCVILANFLWIFLACTNNIARATLALSADDIKKHDDIPVLARKMKTQSLDDLKRLEDLILKCKTLEGSNLRNFNKNKKKEEKAPMLCHTKKIFQPVGYDEERGMVVIETKKRGISSEVLQAASDVKTAARQASKAIKNYIDTKNNALNTTNSQSRSMLERLIDSIEEEELETTSSSEVEGKEVLVKESLQLTNLATSSGKHKKKKKN